MTTRTVVFDLSTYPGIVRPMYYGCCYIVEWRRYEYFDARKVLDIKKLIARLKTATEIVSFNGIAFDLEVLRQHHGLIGPVPTQGCHTDLLVVLNEKARSCNLDEAAQLNLGVSKIDINALEHDPVDRKHAQKACRSDVRLTYGLWKLHKKGELKCP